MLLLFEIQIKYYGYYDYYPIWTTNLLCVLPFQPTSNVIDNLDKILKWHYANLNIGFVGRFFHDGRRDGEDGRVGILVVVAVVVRQLLVFQILWLCFTAWKK